MIGFFNKAKSRLDVHTVEVIRKSSASLIVKVLGMIVGLGVSITLGRELGAEGLGIINLSNRIVGILLVLIMLGMDQIILKEVAIGYSKKNWTQINSVISTSIKVNGTLGLIVILCSVLIVPMLVSKVFEEPDLEIPLYIAVGAMFPQIFSRIYGASLNGCKKVWQSNLVNDTLSVWIVGITLLIWIFIRKEVTIIDVAWFYAVGRVVVALTMIVYWYSLRTKTKGANFLYKYLLKASLPMLIVNATTIVAASVDTLMLGWLSNAKEVGLYSVAARLALLTSFFLQISNSAISPKLASLFSEGRLTEMKIMVNRVSKGLIFIASFSILGFLFFGKAVLSIWGYEFIQAYYILMILAVGQFVNISTGPAGYVLVMGGKQKVLGKITIFSLIINICLNMVLIRYYGAIGAAVATSFGVLLENMFKLYYSKRLIEVRG